MQGGNKRACTNHRYDNKTTNSTGKSDIIQKCTNATERASGEHTAENPQVYTTTVAPHNVAHVISARDTVRPTTADDDGRVRSRHAHSGRSDSWTRNTDNADETVEADETETKTDCSSDWTATLNLQTQ